MANERYTANVKKGTRGQCGGLGTELHSLTKNKTRKNGAKVRSIRTGTLQPAECRYRQIIAPRKTGRTMLRRKRFRRSTVCGGAAPNRCDSGGEVLEATQEGENVDLIIPNSKLHLHMKKIVTLFFEIFQYRYFKTFYQYF